jgi:L-alanine-DL-glutamate epimerase-like enolase superfamily enzyme
VDVALWDLKGRLLQQPLAALLGRVRTGVPVYASGGFTSLSLAELRHHVERYTERGMRAVKIKVGREPSADPARAHAARAALGDEGELFVDANGAYDRQQALELAERFAEARVTWFEEPVSSDDLRGLRWLRRRVPAGMEITAGEYESDLFEFRRMLEADAVDVLMPDATRCGGISGFLEVGALCAAHGVPMSAHTAPAVHVHPCCALRMVRHLEWFHDHARIERMLFDGMGEPVDGVLYPDMTRPGIGIEFKWRDAARYAA